ncbi:MAG: aminopeptidase [Nitrosomonadaceae bacterium]|nr:aminopeptidase [Nitrosomonadaceae bacterium]
MDSRLNKYAEVLVDYSTRIKEGEQVLLRGGVLGAPLLNTVHKRILEKGATAFVMPFLEHEKEIYFNSASDEVIQTVNPVLKHIYETFDAIITIWAEGNTRSMTNVDPQKLQWHETALRDNSKIVLKRSEPWMKANAWDDVPKGALRWVGCQFPTPAVAMDAEMGMYEYTDFLYESVGALVKDPVKHWHTVAKQQQKYVDRLDKASWIHVIGPYIDMTFFVKGRKWINCDGRFNMPDGEVFTAPVEDKVNGWARFTYPSVMKSRLVEDIEIQMEDGLCTSATAKTDDQTKFLNTMLDTDKYCRRIGELAFGLNPFITKGTKNILFDEKISKTMHMAFGVGYPETGSRNQDAGIHWDMVCDMSEGEIKADGELIYKNGRFTF